jgi:hypothetical protein
VWALIASVIRALSSSIPAVTFAIRAASIRSV